MTDKKRPGPAKQNIEPIQVLLTRRQIEWLDARAEQATDSRSGILRRLIQSAVEAEPLAQESR